MIQPNILIFPKPFHQNPLNKIQQIPERLIFIPKQPFLNSNNNKFIQKIGYVSHEVLSKRMSMCVIDHQQLTNKQIRQNIKENDNNKNKMNIKIPKFTKQNKQNRKIISLQSTARETQRNIQYQQQNIKTPRNSRPYNINLNTDKINNSIPSLLIKYNTQIPSSKLGLYYHANAQDIINSYQFIKKLSDWLCMDILVVEYPGYSIYQNNKSQNNIDQNQQQQCLCTNNISTPKSPPIIPTSTSMILQDIPFIINYIQTNLQYSLPNTFVIGRSIGTCFSLHISKNYPQIGGMLLISPFTSFKQVVSNLYGPIAAILSKQISDNLMDCQKIQCPVLIIHGLQDRMINYTHSIELFSKIKSYCQVKVIQKMTHNKFNYQMHLFQHLKQFMENIGFYV